MSTHREGRLFALHAGPQLTVQSSVPCLQAAAGGAVIPLGRQAELWTGNRIFSSLRAGLQQECLRVTETPLRERHKMLRPCQPSPGEPASPSPFFSFLAALPTRAVNPCDFSLLRRRSPCQREQKLSGVFEEHDGRSASKKHQHGPVLPNPLITVCLVETRSRTLRASTRTTLWCSWSVKHLC